MPSSSIVTGTTGSVTWADFNFAAEYSASTANYRKISFTVPSTADNLGVRAFTLAGSVYSGSAASTVAVSTIAVGDVLSAFTTISGTTVTMIFSTASVATNASSSQTVLTASYNLTPQNATTVGTSRGDFEDTSFNVGTPGIAIPEVNVQLKSEAIVAKTRKLKAQWTRAFNKILDKWGIGGI